MLVDEIDDVDVAVVFDVFPFETSMFVLFSFDNVDVLVGPLLAASYLTVEEVCWEFIFVLLDEEDDDVDGVKSFSLTSLILLLLLFVSNCC